MEVVRIKDPTRKEHLSMGRNSLSSSLFFISRASKGRAHVTKAVALLRKIGEVVRRVISGDGRRFAGKRFKFWCAGKKGRKFFRVEDFFGLMNFSFAIEEIMQGSKRMKRFIRQLARQYEDVYNDLVFAEPWHDRQEENEGSIDTDLLALPVMVGF